MISLLLALSLLAQADCPNGKCPIPSTRGNRAAYSTDSIPSSGSYAQIVVRIANDTGRSISYGSGVILTRSGLVLTCRHIFRDGIGTITVWRSDGSSWRAKYLGADKQDDLAAVSISDPGNIPEIWYATQQPQTATLIGFPGGGKSALATGGDYRRSESVTYGMPALQGVSGGPLFCRGRLVLAGVLWGSDGSTSAYTSIHDVRRFLYSETCLRFFQRRPAINIVNNNGGSPPSSVLPEPTPLPIAPAPVQVPVVVPPIAPPTPIALKGDKGDTGATGANGADGKPGKDGATGANGKDGVSPSLGTLKPITFLVTGPDGVVQTAVAHLGDTVNLNLSTIAPVLNPAAKTAK